MVTVYDQPMSAWRVAFARGDECVAATPWRGVGKARKSFIYRKPRSDDERGCAKSALWGISHRIYSKLVRDSYFCAGSGNSSEFHPSILCAPPQSVSVLRTSTHCGVSEI
jgi:hypothetical protein